MTFNELLERRRSIRKYKDISVSADIINELIRESILAPSAGNEQPWEFTVVHDRVLMKRISDESKKNILTRINKHPEDSAGKYRKMLENESFNVFYNAPVLVVISGDKARRNLVADCSLAACYFMMAATARGLGTCWINLGADIRDPELKNELGMSEKTQIVAPIILGYPVRIHAVPRRKEPVVKSITLNKGDSNVF